MKSPMLFCMVPSVTPMTSTSPRLAFTTPTKTPIAIISGMAIGLRISKFSMHIHTESIRTKVHQNIFGKSIHRHSQGVSKTFRALTYKAHRMAIFATAQLSCLQLNAFIICLQCFDAVGLAARRASSL